MDAPTDRRVSTAHIGIGLWVVAVAGCLVSSLNMGPRSTFGLFLTPMTGDLGLGREAFAFAMAVQNIIWGVFTPILGAIADRYGSLRVMASGALLYAVGMWVLGQAEGVFGLNLGGGVLIGLALAGTGFGVVLGAVGRRVPAEKRSLALGIASMGGSLGQFYMAPVGKALLTAHGWSGALTYMALIVLLIVPFALVLTRRPLVAQSDARAGAETQTMGQAMGEASTHRGYWLLTLGFFVCGFQIFFITIHFPAYLSDLGLGVDVAAIAISVIGLFNIFGTWLCGVMGGRMQKKWVLSWLYFLRSFAIVGLLMAPKTETNVLIFAAVMGVLWLGTVPLTSGLVAHMFGVRYLSTLFGFTFFSHQVGGFLGIWLGGYLYDTTGSYDVVWWGAIWLGFLAAALHLPIPERREAEAAA